MSKRVQRTPTPQPYALQLQQRDFFQCGWSMCVLFEGGMIYTASGIYNPLYL